MDTTLDEARRCPCCEELGNLLRKTRISNGFLHVFTCENSRCKKKDREWIVQVRPDGTIPTPSKNRDKQFYVDPGVAKSRTEAIRRQLDIQNTATKTSGGYELRT